jgi:multidrug efflux pump subunit AcrB
MLEALRDAIIFTLIVVLFFLGNFRAIAAATITIPMVFFSTMAIIWLMGGALDLVIYTAIILALGMLADDAVVVLENVERHINELGEDLDTAITEGTKEVIAPIWAGTLATIFVIFPLMFIGGFPEKLFKPMILTLIIALLASFFLSITFIPQLLKFFFKNGTSKTKVELWFDGFYEKTFGRLVKPYTNVLKFTNGKNKILRRISLIVGILVVMVFSVKTIMPTIGKDAMPPMDTGIIKAQVAFSSNETVDSAEKSLKPFLEWLHQQEWVVRSSVAFGAETGVLSLGSGNLPSEATITINCINRFDRELNIWEIEDQIRDKIATLDGVKKNDVYDFGATAVSSIKSSLNVRLKSPTVDGLAEKSHEVAEAIKDIRGLTSVSTSWDKDFTEYILDVDENKALSYGITPFQIAAQIPIKGQIVSLNANYQSMNSQPVRLYMKGKFNENVQALRLLPIHTKFGDIPLEQIATISKNLTYAKIERSKMLYSIDIGASRTKRPITHITDDVEAALIDIKSDHDVIITQEGDIAQINDSFSRMMKAIALGIILLTIGLIAIYKSVKMALIMILVLPLSLIGAAWGMLLFDKPSCMPSMLGILLLFGIIIKNAVLLIDFYQNFRNTGEAPFESALESVKIRFRPVMMTAFATIAGMIPIALERAVGLERLSPLSDVAIGGLLVGTLLTLIYIPMFAYIVDNKK